MGEDIRKLDYGQHIVSGTPGRVFDMIKRRNLRTRNIKMFILDEADEMLNKGWSIVLPQGLCIIPQITCTLLCMCMYVIMSHRGVLCVCVCVLSCVLYFGAGFKEQIYDVYRYLPPATQVCSCRVP